MQKKEIISLDVADEDCPVYGKKDFCKLSFILADIRQLSCVERHSYWNDAKSSCAEEKGHDIT